MIINDFQRMLEIAIFKTLALDKDIISYNNSNTALHSIEFGIYDISQFAPDVKSFIKADPSKFKHIAGVESLKVFDIGTIDVPFSSNKNCDADGISISISARPGFFKWKIKKLFGIDINPKNDQELMSVVQQYVQHLFNPYIRSCRMTSLYNLGVVMIHIDNIQYK